MFKDKYTIVVIDEDIESFQGISSRMENDSIEFIHIDPNAYPEIQMIMDAIYHSQADLVIIDYMYKGSSISGTDIYKMIDTYNPYIFKYILTSYVGDALEDSVKLNDVISRDEDIYEKLNQDSMISMENYRKDIKKTFDELEKLIEKVESGESQDKLNDEKRIFDLNRKVVHFYGESDIRYDLLDKQVKQDLEKLIILGNKILED